MARGRFLSKKVCLNRKFNTLSNDTCRLGFILTIPHLDVKGRIIGDPAVLKSVIFPRRDDISPENVESFIKEWAKSGFVIWYKADGDMFLQFPKFKENQVGLRENREEPSNIPPPDEGEIIDVNTPELLRNNSGKNGAQHDGATPESLPPNISKENISKENLIILQDGSGKPPPAAEKGEKSRSPPVQKREIYHLIEEAFLKKNQEFNFKRESPHIKQLEEKCLARGSPEQFARTLLVTFWKLTHSPREKLFKDKPFLPSILNSGGLYPYVLKAMENQELDDRDIVKVF